MGRDPANRLRRATPPTHRSTGPRCPRLGAAIHTADRRRSRRRRRIIPRHRAFECLAVQWGIWKMRHYLERYRFVVLTDHQSLKLLEKIDNPSGRLARWAMELGQCDFEIRYRRGPKNTVADALSRKPSPVITHRGEKSKHHLRVEDLAACRRSPEGVPERVPENQSGPSDTHCPWKKPEDQREPQPGPAVTPSSQRSEWKIPQESGGRLPPTRRIPPRRGVRETLQYSLFITTVVALFEPPTLSKNPGMLEHLQERATQHDVPVT